ncbi:MAG: glycosyltransferase family 25 protein [Burkholderiaceae bacterium]|jgi:glycosyl transferase family 25|nr:glycosyltransferase family 25 protein [Burkholderiaceae bacterium]
MSVNRRVDAVFVLSVRSFSDRIAHIEAEMARHGIAFEFVFEYDANAIPPELIDRMFAPSDMKRAHQSLVLKHVRTWQLAIERGLARVLVFEDDAVLARDFSARFEAALDEAERLVPGWLLYLGRGDNRHVGAGAGGTALIPGGTLPATDALVFDQEAARRRLAFLETHRITRPADWLTREIDAAVGVSHHWLREPIVVQGSMNGRFESVLDTKRQVRGRGYTWLRFRWDAWWKRLRQNLGVRGGR